MIREADAIWRLHDVRVALDRTGDACLDDGYEA
jgi:hypothetical protein